MKQGILKLTVALLLACCMMPATAQPLFGTSEKFNAGWLFIQHDEEHANTDDYDDSEWNRIRLPHDWSVKGQLSPTLASCTGYLPAGIGWYRKHFEITDLSQRHYIYFEGVYNRSEVYLNGHLLGKRPNGYISFLYDMTPYLRQGENILSVRVDHSRHADSRWYTGSGIYRDVWLVTAPQSHLSLWGTTYRALSITDREARVEMEVAMERHDTEKASFRLRTVVCDREGNKVAQRMYSVNEKAPKSIFPITIPRPHRWNLEDPYLYTVKVELLRNGETVDRCDLRMGLRTLDFSADHGFALNGRQMKVKGVCLHHDAGVLGAAVPREVWSRRLDNLKKIGVNAIRMSHNPQATMLYDLCDEKGLLVMDEGSDEWEFPKRKWVEGWNVGTPVFQGSYDFFEEWIERDVADMVLRDRNHPSVFLWSIGNEVDYPNDPYSHPILNGSQINQPMFGGYNPEAPHAERIGKIAKRLAAVVRSIDASRAVTGALAGVVMSNETEYPQAVDVVGYNYTEDRYDTDHRKYPDRVIYGSENVSTYEAWQHVSSREFIFGQFIWTGTDYLGESGRWPSRGFYTGLLDFGSFCKPRGYFRASLWSEEPMTYIGTYPQSDDLSIDAWDNWNYEAGTPVRVVCYTNAPYARLLLNGRTVGEMKPYDTSTGVISWDLPYADGELRAEGCDADGKVLSSYSITTSGRPYALKVSADRSSLSKDFATAHLTVEVVDEQGVAVKLADNNITCTIEGGAELLGLEGSDNSDMSDYTDNVHRVYRGRLLAYVRTTGTAGDITVKFTSPLLKSASVSLKAE